MGNSMKPAGAKACAFRGRVATFNEEKETEKASSALMVLSGRVLAQAYIGSLDGEALILAAINSFHVCT